MKARVIILTGLPYSGKTTLRNQLVKHLGCAYVSVDDEINARNFEVEEMTQGDWNLVYSAAYEKLESFLKAGKDVVVDIGNLKRRERDNARAIAEKAGASTKLIWINTPVSVVNQRRSQNIETRKRGHLEDQTMQKALGMFEEPTEDEKPILYNSEIALEELLEKLGVIDGDRTRNL
jgi:predicted kinase